MLRSGCLLVLVCSPMAHAQVIRAIGRGNVLPGPIMIRTMPSAVTPITGTYPSPLFYNGWPHFDNFNYNYNRPGGFVPYYGLGGGLGYPQTTIVNNNTTVVNNSVSIVIPTAPARNTGRVTMHVPKDAVVYVNGEKLAQSGSVRVVETPELLGEQTHILKLRVTWQERGKSQEENREMELRTGDRRAWTIVGLDGD